MTILAVDDEYFALELMRKALEEAAVGATIYLCRDVQSAIETAEAQKIDVAFLDIHLPQKNGIELADGTLCLEAEVRMLEGTDEPTAEVKICEGKYHQVKRMFAALGNKVVYLKRVRMGGLDLDENLGEGQCREIISLLSKILSSVTYFTLLSHIS